MSEDTTKGEYVALQPTDVVKYSGFDDAMVGVGQQLGGPPVAVYLFEKVIELIVEADKCSPEEAVEKFKTEVVQMSFGVRTPMIIYPPEETDAPHDDA